MTMNRPTTDQIRMFLDVVSSVCGELSRALSYRENAIREREEKNERDRQRRREKKANMFAAELKKDHPEIFEDGQTRVWVQGEQVSS